MMPGTVDLDNRAGRPIEVRDHHRELVLGPVRLAEAALDTDTDIVDEPSEDEKPGERVPEGGEPGEVPRELQELAETPSALQQWLGSASPWASLEHGQYSQPPRLPAERARRGRTVE